LRYLDDRPVFEDDRRHAEAFHRGGIDEERAERELIKTEEREKHHEYHRKFKEMMRRAREEKRAEDEAKHRAVAEAKGEKYEAPLPSHLPLDDEGKPISSDLHDLIAIAAEEKRKAMEPKVYEVTDENKDSNTSAVSDEDAPPELEQVDIEAERILR